MMKLIKMMMVCILLAPTLCWGMKFEGPLMTALSRVRAPMVKMSQTGLDSMSFQGRQYHGRSLFEKGDRSPAASLQKKGVSSVKCECPAHDLQVVTTLSKQNSQLMEENEKLKDGINRLKSKSTRHWLFFTGIMVVSFIYR